eukprot:g11155.t1
MGQMHANPLQAWSRANADSETFLHCAAARRNFWVMRFVASHAWELLFQQSVRANAIQVLLEKLEEVGVVRPAAAAPDVEVPQTWMNFAQYLPHRAERGSAFADVELEVQESSTCYRSIAAHRCVLGAASGDPLGRIAQTKTLAPCSPCVLACGAKLEAMGVAPCAGEHVQSCCSSEPFATCPEVRQENGFKEEIATHIVRKHSALEPKYEKTLAQHLATSPAGHAVWNGTGVEAASPQACSSDFVPEELAQTKTGMAMQLPKHAVAMQFTMIL